MNYAFCLSLRRDAREDFAGDGIRDRSSAPDGSLVGDVNDEEGGALEHSRSKSHVMQVESAAQYPADWKSAAEVSGGSTSIARTYDAVRTLSEVQRSSLLATAGNSNSVDEHTVCAINPNVFQLEPAVISAEDKSGYGGANRGSLRVAMR